MLKSRPAVAARLVASALAVTLALAVAACGGDDASTEIDAPTPGDDAATGDASPPDAGGPDAPAAALALTSTAIVEGGTIPIMYSCRGVNVSPPLAWTGGAAATGYAMVLTDLSNGLVHSIIWDVPAATTSLPENVAKVAEPAVPAGSKQPLAYDNQTRGYLGPCPTTPHNYQFSLHAVDAYPLPGVTLSSNRAAVRAAITAHELDVATLTATFTP